MLTHITPIHILYRMDKYSAPISLSADRVYVNKPHRKRKKGWGIKKIWMSILGLFHEG